MDGRTSWHSQLYHRFNHAAFLIGQTAIPASRTIAYIAILLLDELYAFINQQPTATMPLAQFQYNRRTGAVCNTNHITGGATYH